MRASSSRPPVLMLHGQPGGARDWAGVIAALDGRVQPIAIDRPGWDGRSHARDLAGNGKAALAELDRLGIDRATIVGHSLGCAIAVWLAAAHPERATALVLAAPAASLASLQPFDRLLALPALGPLVSSASLTGLGLALAVGPVRARVTAHNGLADGYLRASGRALLRPSALRAFATEQRGLEDDLRTAENRLGDVRAPTRVVVGERDRIVPLAGARALTGQIVGARLIVVDGAGHLLPQLHPADLAEAILAALA
ncbi:MAG: alpha/beta fold hydrolase [Solirubrobacteraceae bacterium]